MLDLPVSVACNRLDEIVDDVRANHEPVFLTRRGRRVAAVIDVEDLEHKNKISPYQGRTLRGVVKRTVLRGRTVDRDSKAGRIVRRP